MAWNQMLTNLRDLLADLYYTQERARRVVDAAGLKPAFIDMEGDSITRWHNILREADRRDKVAAIVQVTYDEYPENNWLAAAAKNDLWAISGADIKKSAWQGEADAAQLEKLMGDKSTLMPIHFLEIGLERARSVVKVVQPAGSGSGFLLPGNLLVTNHHVLPSPEIARTATILCNYQKTRDGLDAPTERFSLVPDAPHGLFHTSNEHDWTIVRVADDANARYGALTLRRKSTKKDAHVNIIQHPGGGPKQIALYHNLVTYADSNLVQYLTDTLPGSSGSPVFDDDWEVVALHHSGGWLREPGVKLACYRNEGIAIDKVIDALEKHGLLTQ
jgi:hypothetical protein